MQNETTQDYVISNQASEETSRYTKMISIPAWVAATASKQAEAAVDEIMARLRDAELVRDDLSRKLGAQQDMVDRLQSERELRSKHLRRLSVALEYNPEQNLTNGEPCSS